jgi:hypothetical protein
MNPFNFVGIKPMYQKISLLAMILMAGASNTFATTTITVSPSATVHIEKSKKKTVVTAVGNSATVHVDSNGNSVTSSASSVKIDPEVGENITISNHGNVSASAIVINEPVDKDVNLPTIEDQNQPKHKHKKNKGKSDPFFDNDPFFDD